MHLGDSIFIFILALVLFGPKKLPEMAKQIGKLMAEFRRASNDFRMQIDEELRTMERQEQQKKQEAERAAAALPSSTPNILPPAAAGEIGELGTAESRLTTGIPQATEIGTGIGTGTGTLQILPPSVGEQVSAGTPYAISAEPAVLTSAAAEDHPLLRVDTIPVDPQGDASQPTGLAAAEANAARLTSSSTVAPLQESEQASLHNG